MALMRFDPFRELNPYGRLSLDMDTRLDLAAPTAVP